MPVNKDPKKRLKKEAPQPEPAKEVGTKVTSEAKDVSKAPKEFGEETERDREAALADAEWKNLWDATEVIDMDKW